MEHDYIARGVGIILTDALLSGDNAMVVALVCQGLPPAQRVWGMILGAGAAIVLRVAAALGGAWLLQWPGVAIAGGLYLLYVAYKMTRHAADDEKAPSTSLLTAVGAIAIADITMSLDNVAAIIGISGGDWHLIVFGILVCVPFVILGAAALMWLLERAPWLIWLGAIALGAIGGKVLVEDPLIQGWAHGAVDERLLLWGAAAVGAALVAGAAGLAWALDRRQAPLVPRTHRG
jgi:YjbE family integral membrane protein